MPSLLVAMLTAVTRDAPCFCYLGSVNALEVVPQLLLLLLHQLLRLELLVVAQHPQHSSPFLACIYSQWLVVYW